MINWQQLLTALGSTAVIMTVIGFVAKRIVEIWLSQRLQSHKVSLEAASQRTLEQFRYELRITEAQQNRLLTKQAEIIADTFAHLERVHQSLVRLAAPINHGETGALELRERAFTAFDDFVQYYHQRAIWLDLSTWEKLNSLVELIATLLVEMNYNLTSDGEIADRKRWLETYKRVEADVPKARNALDHQFRSLLGVASNSQTSQVEP